ncbi:hypothetical protein [Lacticaseibacillus sharpeae]|uniref:Uncharacterized protein n=2 Tax=Lacticaseibacillus sharpeae TaxID=1626 RepID=A0A0R1ZIE8_9LACO|nr:hypothetical protein [Lacticaseibacillus sharpeae]KRM54686.1 hypothetical protein FC18_GL002277 [Lacticaseibacillus sharpeae JCM 1186 = DSM 20505]
MTLIVIILDAFAAVCYLFLAQGQSNALITVGAGVQIVITILLLILTIMFNGHRRARYWTSTYHPFTFRFGIILLSLVGNALIALLYVMYVTGTNTILFR